MALKKNLNVMNKYSLSLWKTLIFYGLVLLFLSCTEDSTKIDDCPLPLAYHEDFYNDVDWEKYNDVWDVFASNNLRCSDPKANENNGKDIKVCGWLMRENNEVSITNDSLYALTGERKFNGRNSWDLLINITSEIQKAIDTCDFIRKCYIKGKLNLKKTGFPCCETGVSVVLEDINNIYFE